MRVFEHILFIKASLLLIVLITNLLLLIKTFLLRIFESTLVHRLEDMASTKSDSPTLVYKAFFEQEIFLVKKLTARFF